MKSQQKFTSIQWMTIILSIFLLLDALPISALPSKNKYPKEKWNDIYGEQDKVICVSIPKAGTHLLIKCLTLLDVDGIEYNYDTEKEWTERLKRPFSRISVQEYAERAFSRLTYRINKNKTKRRSFLVHLPFSEKHRFFFDRFTVANFLMIRDPRDQLISLAATSLKDPTNREVGLEETLLDLLEGKKRHTPWERRHGACDLMWTIGITEFYRAFLKWENEPNFCVIRFENLIGEQGGGTLEAQIDEIHKIATHLGFEPTEEQVQHTINHLYGETRTFKKGQSQAWRKYFTPRVIEAFKKVPGACELLIELGYEQDLDW